MYTLHITHYTVFMRSVADAAVDRVALQIMQFILCPWTVSLALVITMPTPLFMNLLTYESLLNLHNYCTVTAMPGP